MHRLKSSIGTQLVAIGKDELDGRHVEVIVAVEGLLHRSQVGVGFAVDDVVGIGALHSQSRNHHQAEVEVRVAEDTVRADGGCHSGIRSGNSCYLRICVVIIIHPGLISKRGGVVGTVVSHYIRSVIDEGVVSTLVVGAVKAIVASSHAPRGQLYLYLHGLVGIGAFCMSVDHGFHVMVVATMTPDTIVL